MKLGNFLAAATLCLSAASAQASTVFSPTDGDVNFLSWNLGGYSLAMFDNDDMNSMSISNALNVPIPSVVAISGGSDYTATNSFGDFITLTNSPEFVLAITNDGGNTWLTDTGAVYLGANTYEVTFGDAGDLFTIDVQISSVPVPAAVWLFGTGLVGLAGIARRRS